MYHISEINQWPDQITQGNKRISILNIKIEQGYSNNMTINNHLVQKRVELRV